MEFQPTGNPVFDFQAAQRASNAKLQKLMLQVGLILFVIGGFALLVARTSGELRSAIAGATALGILLIVGSLAFGFHWRKKMQREFRKAYGNENAQ